MPDWDASGCKSQYRHLDLIALPAETWHAIRDRAEQLLTAAEVDGLTGAIMWLTARRLAWSWATPAPRLQRTPVQRRAPRPSRPQVWTDRS
jgi:hypothetical protein